MKYLSHNFYGGWDNWWNAVISPIPFYTTIGNPVCWNQHLPPGNHRCLSLVMGRALTGWRDSSYNWHWVIPGINNRDDIFARWPIEPADNCDWCFQPIEGGLSCCDGWGH